MSETLDDTAKFSSETASWFGAAVIGVVFGCLFAFPIWYLSSQRGIAIGMILIPMFTLLAYVLGGLTPFVKYLGLLFAALFVGTINNLIPVAHLLPSDSDKESVDPVTQAELETKARILETDSESEFDRLAEILRARDRFVRQRKLVLIIGAVIATIGTALVLWDGARLNDGMGSVVVPTEWKDTKSENLYAAFPLIFVLVSVPLCTVFASYPVSYALGCLAGSLYFGTAFYLLFQASSPELPFWILPLSIFVLLAGIGLAIDWVTAESSPEDAPSPSDS